MSIGFGFGAGLKALSAARLAIQTAGQNVANANTPGYSRQRVLQSSALPFQIARGFQVGSGVEVNDIQRIIDGGLIRRMNLQASLFGEADAKFTRLSEIEGIFDEPDGGLSNGLADFFGNISSLQTDPGDRALRGGVVQSSRTLAENFNLLARRFGDFADNTLDEVRGLVRQVNEHAGQIADLNTQIISLEANGSSANDLRDQRSQLIGEISSLVDTRTLERSTGSVDVLVAGHLLVAGSRSSQLTARPDNIGNAEVVVGNSTGLDVKSGKIGALLSQQGVEIPGILGNLDRLARNLALEVNRIQTTGVPGSGPFQALIASNGATDADNDGQRGDELLSATGLLPFDVQRGDLYVTVTDRSTGDISRSRISVDPSSMTLTDLAAELNGVERLSAVVDPAGRLRVTAESGFGFDFGSRLDELPDSFHSFGSGFPALGSNDAEPFDLTASPFPQQFDVTVNGTPETVTLNQADFRNISAATAQELAAAINDDLTNATAREVGGRLVIRANSSGSSSSLSLADTTGTPLASIGMATGPAAGQDDDVGMTVTGAYTGPDNGQLIFVPNSDGEIGRTPGLTVGVFDRTGKQVATLDVGAGYVVGDQIDVADGVKVSFNHGTLSATSNEVTALDTLADSDTSDVLVALGMNSLFLGNSASDLSVNPDFEANPDLLAAGLKNASADGANLERLMTLRDTGLTEFGNTSIEDFYGDIVGNLGFDVWTAERTLEAQESLMTNLEDQRESVSGVNLDEEMVDLVRFQQAFEAASRFINTVQELSNTLINLGR